MAEVSISDKIRTRAAWISAIASISIFFIKVYAYRITGSAAVLSDALESIVNVLAAVVALFVVKLSMEPADDNHPYGHGKAESFSSTFEGGMIFFAAVIIIAESVKALIANEPPKEIELGLLIVGGSAVLNLVLGFYLNQVGKKHKSDALKASGKHVLSDVITTAGVMVGLGLVLLTGISWLDPAIAILVGLHLAYSGYGIVRESLGVLMDETNLPVLEDLAQSVQRNRRPGVIDIHQLRTIRSGRFHHVDAHIVLPEYWEIAEAHAFLNAFEADVVEDYEFDGELAFHIDPCKMAFCQVCKVANCPIRQQAFVAERPFTVKSLTGGPEPTNSVPYDDTRPSQTD